MCGCCGLEVSFWSVWLAVGKRECRELWPHLSEAKPVAEGRVTVKLLPNGVSCNSAGELMKPDNQYCGRPASVGTTSSIAVCASVSTSSNPTVDVPSESLCSLLANSTDAVSPRISESNRSSKARTMFLPFGTYLCVISPPLTVKFIWQSSGHWLSRQ
ncbi:hypothetical protein POTOM_003260 [Populus tomentosa]|uniref:Uncharacterized protein n=1 Tax=Populus tomentosa TaxID=118781 RepID=A0A8X8IYR4_POPTO|nr:hypothetical protein POTOM_003260 [Populus tomentosa]